MKCPIPPQIFSGLTSPEKGEKRCKLISSKVTNTRLQDSLTKQTCKKPLKGASPVPGPIMIIGVDGSAGNLKFDCLTKIGAQLHSSLYSKGIVFCQAHYHRRINQTAGLFLIAGNLRDLLCQKENVARDLPSSMLNKLLGGSFLLVKVHKPMRMLHEFWMEPSCRGSI